MDHNIYKIIETHRKEFGAQSGREVLGEEYSLDNLQRVVMKPSRGWIKNQPVPKRTQAVEAWCRLAWQQAPQLWNNRKFHMSQTKHEFQIYWTVHFEERIPKNLETLLFYTKKTLACCYRKQLLAREDDRLDKIIQGDIDWQGNWRGLLGVTIQERLNGTDTAEESESFW